MPPPHWMQSVERAFPSMTDADATSIGRSASPPGSLSASPSVR
jgi:hypothetical protein